MDIELKEKIPVTDKLLKELADKSWLEIEYLQTQLKNLDDDQKLQQLLNNLITSYYVFIGGLENLQAGDDLLAVETSEESDILKSTVFDEVDTVSLSDFYKDEASTSENQVVEPFEYFVDFDEPVGKPISDEELYGVN